MYADWLGDVFKGNNNRKCALIGVELNKKAIVKFDFNDCFLLFYYLLLPLSPRGASARVFCENKTIAGNFKIIPQNFLTCVFVFWK